MFVTPLLSLLAAAVPAVADEHEHDLPHIPVQKYALDNGLDVILAHDPSLPIVQVNVWYHVGSKDEEPGLTGFAHLFEHLMFQGSVSQPGDYFGPLQTIGGRVNGTTSFDRTNYFQTVPSEYLPLVLFLESDRMGWLLDVLDQSDLDNQRDVVRNERRQRYDNRPYGNAWVYLFDAIWPEDHPYGHLPIGSHKDLQAASLEVVHDFFRTWYAPDNASLVIAGDFEPNATKELVEEYFGPIAPRGDFPHAQAEPFRLEEDVDIRHYEDVPDKKLWLAWHAPAIYEPGDAELDLLGSILADGPASRLEQHLVRDLEVAKEVNAGQWSLELGSLFVITATAADGHTTDEVVEAIDEVLAGIIDDQPATDDEVEAAKAGYEMGFYRRIATVAGRADLLNQYNYYTGDPDFIGEDLLRYRRATAEGVTEHAREVLSGGRGMLHIWPESDRPAATDAEEDSP